MGNSNAVRPLLAVLLLLSATTELSTAHSGRLMHPHALPPAFSDSDNEPHLSFYEDPSAWQQTSPTPPTVASHTPDLQSNQASFRFRTHEMNKKARESVSQVAKKEEQQQPFMNVGTDPNLSGPPQAAAASKPSYTVAPVSTQTAAQEDTEYDLKHNPYPESPMTRGLRRQGNLYCPFVEVVDHDGLPTAGNIIGVRQCPYENGYCCKELNACCPQDHICAGVLNGAKCIKYKVRRHIIVKPTYVIRTYDLSEQQYKHTPAGVADQIADSNFNKAIAEGRTVGEDGTTALNGATVMGPGSESGTQTASDFVAPHPVGSDAANQPTKPKTPSVLQSTSPNLVPHLPAGSTSDVTKDVITGELRVITRPSTPPPAARSEKSIAQAQNKDAKTNGANDYQKMQEQKETQDSEPSSSEPPKIEMIPSARLVILKPEPPHNQMFVDNTNIVQKGVSEGRVGGVNADLDDAEKYMDQAKDAENQGFWAKAYYDSRIAGRPLKAAVTELLRLNAIKGQAEIEDMKVQQQRMQRLSERLKALQAVLKIKNNIEKYVDEAEQCFFNVKELHAKKEYVQALSTTASCKATLSSVQSDIQMISRQNVPIEEKRAILLKNNKLADLDQKIVIEENSIRDDMQTEASALAAAQIKALTEQAAPQEMPKEIDNYLGIVSNALNLMEDRINAGKFSDATAICKKEQCDKQIQRAKDALEVVKKTASPALLVTVDDKSALILQYTNRLNHLNRELQGQQASADFVKQAADLEAAGRLDETDRDVVAAASGLDKIKKGCEALCNKKKSRDYLNYPLRWNYGPCLSDDDDAWQNTLDFKDYACDVAHNPFDPLDANDANQCQDFKLQKRHHVVSVDPLKCIAFGVD